MCGICGIALSGARNPDASALDPMCSVIAHRGPDDQGTYVGDGVALGMRRLSIIDLEGGHQPIPNEDSSLWIVFNGEIYNFPELRRELLAAGHRFSTQSDTEVVLHGFEQWREACVQRLNGMFAFAIWDRNRRELFLARDRVGIKPLHYMQQGRDLLFGSEIKSILAYPSVRREVDPSSLSDYLQLEYVPTPHTIFHGIRKLPPGCTLTWRQGEGVACLRRYWDADLSRSEGSDGAATVDEEASRLLSVLETSVRRELISDVPVGVFLSGGIDSSAIAAMMTRVTPGNVESFSIGFRDPSFDESMYARLVARHLGTNHHELILEAEMLHSLVPDITAMLDEPMADASLVPTFLLSRFAREHVKVALGGDGGDELFAGYPTLQAHRLAAYYRRLPGFVVQGLAPALVRQLPVSLDNISLDFKAKRFVDGAMHPVGPRHTRWLGSFTPESRDALLSDDVRAEAGKSRLDAVAAHLESQAARDPLNQVLYLDMKMYLENDILVKLDRASMMASLEARVPMLNMDVVELATSLPLHFKLRGLQGKHLLRRALRPLLPAVVLRRGKKGFGIPVGKWFQGPLRPALLQALDRDRIEREGFFSYPAVRALVEDHLSGRRDCRKQLWTLYVFQRWHETYMTASTRTAASAVLR